MANEFLDNKIIKQSHKAGHCKVKSRLHCINRAAADSDDRQVISAKANISQERPHLKASGPLFTLCCLECVCLRCMLLCPTGIKKLIKYKTPNWEFKPKVANTASIYHDD